MRALRPSRLGALLLSVLLLGGLFAALPVAALPVVPYCGPASLGGAAPQGSPAISPEVCEALTGRVFPEAVMRPEYVVPDAAGHMNTGFATDFVGFFEFQAGLSYLAAQYPQYITVHEVAQSYGLCAAGLPVGGVCPGGLDRFPVYMVEVTNNDSPVPLEERQALLFMLSIHGVEKGGREGGLRVLEDLVKGISMGAETVQHGAGMPAPLPRPTGEGEVRTYQDYLDFQRVFLLFANSDGWVHDELPYVLTSPPGCGAPPNGILFCRTNGNGTDLNRQAPTLGWQNPNRHVMNEPEAVGYYTWMREEVPTWHYAVDIHGMLNHQNFVAIMLPASSMTPQEMQRSMRLAETLKERLNGNPHFAEWENVFASGEQADGAVRDFLCETMLCPGPGSALSAAGSSQFAEYYTVIDAIGYTDSGFNGDYFAQDTGLNAPGYDIELAYNHITFDSAYPAGAAFNDYHVKSVREIVKSFMDAAALDVTISYDTGGLRTLYLEPTFVATNLGRDQPDAGGWAAQNPLDDLWAYSEGDPFFARPAKYWEDIRPFLCDGCKADPDTATPGVLVRTSADRITREQLDRHNTFVIPGSAIKEIENDAATLQTILSWVERGGNLVLTDEALRFFDLAGVTDGAVDVVTRYMGGIRMDLEHPMLAKVRGGVKQTYEPTPLGFAVGANAAPNWYIDAAAFAAIGGSVAGRQCGGPQLMENCDNNGIALGSVDVQAGRIQFIGALLPDPSEEFYHPYGLDHYATTYSGNQILRNMLGWDEVFAAPPVVITEDGRIIQSPNQPPLGDDDPDPSAGQRRWTPGPAGLVVLVLLAALAVTRRRWV